jgi:hypothetical protein
MILFNLHKLRDVCCNHGGYAYPRLKSTALKHQITMLSCTTPPMEFLEGKHFEECISGDTIPRVVHYAVDNPAYVLLPEIC